MSSASKYCERQGLNGSRAQILLMICWLKWLMKEAPANLQIAQMASEVVVKDRLIQPK